MTVKELREVLELADPDAEAVVVQMLEPAPDGEEAILHQSIIRVVGFREDPINGIGAMVELRVNASELPHLERSP
jgi:hypothetical protein